jgi:hypothetical protein
MFGHPTDFCDIIIQVVRSGIDVNRSTQRIGCDQDYSVWQFYLLWLQKYFREHPDFHTPYPPGDNSYEGYESEPRAKRVRDTTRIFRVFLQHGADPFAVISSMDWIECWERDFTVKQATFLSVADVIKDLRAAATWQLAHYVDPHAYLALRLSVVGELEELLDEACVQRDLASSHATALRATSQPNHWLKG